MESDGRLVLSCHVMSCLEIFYLGGCAREKMKGRGKQTEVMLALTLSSCELVDRSEQWAKLRAFPQKDRRPQPSTPGLLFAREIS